MGIHHLKPSSEENAMTDHYFNAPLAEVDPEIAQVLDRELQRQRGYLEMIASENFVPVSIPVSYTHLTLPTNREV